MSPAKKEISLLPNEADANSLSARITRWLTTVGRFVIVFTELIVISAFLSRFWLDRKNSDLSDVIRQQKAIIDSTMDFEKEYNLLQKKLEVIGLLYKKQPEYKSGLLTLAESTPSDIIYDSLSVELDKDNNVKASLSLVAFQESSIIDFITNLVLNPKVKSVSVNTIEKKSKDARYLVSISVKFIPYGQKSTN